MRPVPKARGAPARLPSFRNVLVHEYVAFDRERVVEAMDELEPVEEMVRLVRAMLEEQG